MNIDQRNFFTILSGIAQYQIPIYQRRYKWDTDNCKKLLEDIVKAGTPGNPNHFIGSVIIKDEPNAGGVNIFNVIDGQQRTTTVSLLLLALEKYYAGNQTLVTSPTTAAILANLKGIYLTNSALNGTSLFSKLYLKDGADRAEYDNLLHGVIGTGKISENYKYFLDELKKNAYNPEYIYSGITNAQIALVTLVAGENPQLLFEAVNDTGVDLTNVDLVRNWIFMGLPGTEQDRLYRAYWQPMETSLDDGLDSFLRYFTELKSSQTVSNDYYKSFKKTFILNTGSVASVEELLQDIKAYSDIYLKYRNKNFADVDINILLSNIARTNKDAFVPLILKVLSNWQNGSVNLDDTKLILKYIESYIVRRDILAVPTNSLVPAMINMLNSCSNLTDFVNRINSLSVRQRMPSDDEIRTQLKVHNFYELNDAYYYLERIEKALNPAFALSDPTIEHILPETMHTNSFPKSGVTNANDYNWELDLGTNAQKIHDTYQHTLGNLTILPRGENARMGDYRFNIKKNWSSIATGGFNYGYLYTPIRISQSLGRCTTWDEAAILNRCDEMVNYICNVWPHP